MATRLFRLSWFLFVCLPLALSAAEAPRELPELEALRKACGGAACSVEERLFLAVARAANWLAGYPGELRFDAAITLHGVRRRLDSPTLRQAYAAARKVADHDRDHPHQRLWRPDYVAPPEHTSRWAVPAAEDERLRINEVLAEALHCDRNGWRPEVQAYVCGAMRDDGGYGTTHAAWALIEAMQRGCAAGAEVEACRRSLVEEMVRAQPATLSPQRTLDIDLYGERLLMVALAQPRHPAILGWVEPLLGRQDEDGSWGTGQDPDPYYRHHATGIAAWALAEVWQQLTPDERASPPTVPRMEGIPTPDI